MLSSSEQETVVIVAQNKKTSITRCARGITNVLSFSSLTMTMRSGSPYYVLLYLNGCATKNEKTKNKEQRIRLFDQYQLLYIYNIIIIILYIYKYSGSLKTLILCSLFFVFSVCFQRYEVVIYTFHLSKNSFRVQINNLHCKQQ